MNSDSSRSKRAVRPLDAAKLRALALHYAGRYATTRHKLKHYLSRKIRERGWAEEEPADLTALAEDFAALGYVDDESFATTRASALVRRGFGAGRVRMSLRSAGIDSAQVEQCTAMSADESLAIALDFARRRRFGPFRDDDDGRKARKRAYAALVRAGHDHEIAQKTLNRINKGDGFPES
jgi:regulatory protein